MRESKTDKKFVTLYYRKKDFQIEKIISRSRINYLLSFVEICNHSSIDSHKWSQTRSSSFATICYLLICKMFYDYLVIIWPNYFLVIANLLAGYFLVTHSIFEDYTYFFLLICLLFSNYMMIVLNFWLTSCQLFDYDFKLLNYCWWLFSYF